ncbi:DEAD/DEAH box helicase [Ralstonia pickettii]|uniref:DEAD/DEAH box helicase n=2 Tax=Bacteria TaxID=2 RepID=UPI002D79823D|nr:DEAD/DEAH box helicase [Ralstonia pickettii]
MKLANYKKGPREFIQGVRSDGFRVGLSTLFAPWMNTFFREREGLWFGQGRMWLFARSRINGQFAAELAANLPKDATFDVASTVQKIKAAFAAPDPDLFAPGLDVQLFPVRGGGYACLFKFDHVLLRAVQALGGGFLRNKNAWRLRQELPEILGVFEAQAGVRRDHVYVHETEIVLEALASLSEADKPSLSVGGMFPEAGARATGDSPGENSILTVVATPLKKLWVNEVQLAEAATAHGLYDYQEGGVRHLLGYSSALLADDMGLGKSRQAVVAATLVQGEGAVLVICPANLRINWQREIHAVDPGARVVIAGDGADWATAEWLVVNYERLGGVVQAINDRVVQFRVMLCDEAHYLKEPDSTRTRNAFLLSKHIDRRFLLTATPVLNRESELHTLLRLAGHPIGGIPLGDFLGEFAGKPELRKTLSDRVSEWMLRRRKDVLKTLKGKSHQVQYVDLAKDEMDEYRKALADDDQVALVKIGKLRRMLECLKAGWLIQTISSLNEDDKAIVFCEFIDSVEFLVEEFAKAGIKAVSYVGDDTVIRKQKAVDSFMVDAQTRVFVGTTRAAGVGLNLTAANYVFFASLPWTAAAQRQAEDRAYRNGQTRHVTVMIPLVSSTIDEQVIELIKHKEGIEQDLLADGSEDGARAEKEMAAKLLQAA